MIGRSFTTVLLFLLCLLGAACSSGSQRDTHGTSTVTLAITGTHASRLSQTARSLMALHPITTVQITISAENMTTISWTGSITPPATVTQAFTVPNGIGRTFLAQLLDASGAVAYEGSKTVDLDGGDVSLDISVAPLFFTGTTLTGSAQRDEAMAVTVDSSGNIIIAGYTYGDLDGNLNSDASHASPDVFVAKFDQYGEKLWTAETGSTGYDLAYGAATDSSGNIYIIGSTDSRLDGQTNAGGADCFVTKYDAAGGKVWTRLIGGPDIDIGTGIAVDASGNVVITGYTYGDMVTSLGTFTNKDLSGLTTDLFVAKLGASDGALIWLDLRGTPYHDQAEAIAVDGAGSIFVTGHTKGDLDNRINQAAVPGSTSDLFLIKYTNGGVRQWTELLGTTDDEQAWAVAVDGGGNVSVAGGTWGSLDGNANTDLSGATADAFVVTYDGGGNKLWSRMLGTPGNELARGIALDASGNVYVTGSTRGSFTGFTNAGGYDVFAARYVPSSQTWLWTGEIGTSADENAYGIAIDKSGNAVITGSTAGNFDAITNAGSFDAFLMSYQQDGVKQ